MTKKKILAITMAFSMLLTTSNTASATIAQTKIPYAKTTLKTTTMYTTPSPTTPPPTVASEYTCGDYTYVLNGSSAKITGYKGTDTSVTIPDTLDGYKVTGVGGNAFWNKDKITEIVLPKTLTHLGSMAFTGTSISEITIPASITSCDNEMAGPFCGIPTLKKVIFENGTTSIPSCILAGGTVWQAMYVEDIVIPSSVISIGDYAFRGCNNFYKESLSLPKDLKKIGKSAFMACSSLKKIILPDALESIGDACFAGCKSLEKIDIPAHLTTIPKEAFSTCTSLTQVSFTDSDIENPSGYIGISAFKDCSSLSEIDFSNTITTIDLQAFSGCSSLETVSLPSHLQQLASEVFFNSALKQITIPATSNLKDIFYYSGLAPFYGANNLETVIFEDGIKRIPGGLCQYSTISYVSIPDSVKIIGSGAFGSCSKLTENGINFPKNLEKIEDYAFSNTGFSILSLPSSLQSLGNSAFSDCTKLENVQLSDSITNIGNLVFANCTSLSTIELPNNLQSIGYKVFTGTLLKEITIPSKVTYSGVTSSGSISSIEGCLSGATQLTTVSFQNNTHYIPAYMLSPKAYGSSPITKVTIPASVINIDENAFSRCDKITIYGYENSYAQTYALEHNIPFVALTMPKIHVSSVTLDKTTATLQPNNSLTLVSTILPADATDPSIIWISSDESIATVDNSGTVTAANPGIVTITASSADNSNATATCTITVTSTPKITESPSFTPDSIEPSNIPSTPDASITSEPKETPQISSSPSFSPIPIETSNTPSITSLPVVPSSTPISVSSAPVQVTHIPSTPDIPVTSEPKETPKITIAPSFSSAPVETSNAPSITPLPVISKDVPTSIPSTPAQESAQPMPTNTPITSSNSTTQQPAISSGNSAISEINNNFPTKGSILEDKTSKAHYKVTTPILNKNTNSIGEVQYIAPTNTLGKIYIPVSITIQGQLYNVTSIAPNAFKNKRKLQSITLSDNIVSIGKNAFYGCSKLKSITLGKNVTSIEDRAFAQCKSLTKITIKTSKLTSKSIKKHAFSGLDTKVIIKVPKKKLLRYKKLFQSKGLSKNIKIVI